MIIDNDIVEDYCPRIIIFTFMKQMIYDLYKYVQVSLLMKRNDMSFVLSLRVVNLSIHIERLITPYDLFFHVTYVTYFNPFSMTRYLAPK